MMICSNDRISKFFLFFFLTMFIEFTYILFSLPFPSIATRLLELLFSVLELLLD